MDKFTIPNKSPTVRNPGGKQYENRNDKGTLQSSSDAQEPLAFPGNRIEARYFKDSALQTFVHLL
jgi:hypothetical protein